MATTDRNAVTTSPYLQTAQLQGDVLVHLVGYF